MQEILLILAGAVILSVVCETLVSGESMKKFATLAIGISVSTVLVIPIVEFLSGDIITDIATPTINEGYIAIIDSQYGEVLQQTIEVCLAELGISAEIICETSGDEILSVSAITKETLTKETAEEIGFAVCELLNLPLYKVVVKGG